MAMRGGHSLLQSNRKPDKGGRLHYESATMARSQEACALESPSTLGNMISPRAEQEVAGMRPYRCASCVFRCR